MHAHTKICLCICRWMRPCRATRAGTQAPPLPASIKPLYHVTSLDFVHRQTILRQSYDASHTRNSRGGACVPVRTSAQRRFHPQRAHPTRKGGISIHKRCMLTPKHVCALRRWMRPCRATRAGTQAPPLPASIKSLFRQSFLMLVRRRRLFQQSFLMFVRRRVPLRQSFLAVDERTRLR